MVEPRCFALVRDTDVTGVSGTGVVAMGCIFPDGSAVTHWMTQVASTAVWDTHSYDEAVAALERIHGHGGQTRIVWFDEAQKAAS